MIDYKSPKIVTKTLIQHECSKCGHLNELDASPLYAELAVAVKGGSSRKLGRESSASYSRRIKGEAEENAAPDNMRCTEPGCLFVGKTQRGLTKHINSAHGALDEGDKHLAEILRKKHEREAKS